MDLNKALVELRQERMQIEEAILSLERLASSQPRRRGRPPGWLTSIRAAKRRGRSTSGKQEPVRCWRG
jgi:hypothetical protein